MLSEREVAELEEWMLACPDPDESEAELEARARWMKQQLARMEPAAAMRLLERARDHHQAQVEQSERIVREAKALKKVFEQAAALSGRPVDSLALDEAQAILRTRA